MQVRFFRLLSLMQPWLSHPRLPVCLGVLAFVLTLPALTIGWQGDDYFHQLVLAEFKPFPDITKRPLDLFAFVNHDPQRTKRLMELGTLPWWASPNLKVAFWRPVTAVTHWLDYQLWPTHSAIMHLQSLLWFASLIAMATILYRRIMGPTWVAGLAALLYAIDDTHGFPASWLANRNALIATFFGLLTLIFHDRWRKEKWRFGAMPALMTLALGLMSAEAAVATCAYLFAYTVFLDAGSKYTRLKVLLPYAILVIFWRIVYDLLEYGAIGSGLYIDPGVEPLRFLLNALLRIPILLLGQWGFPPSDVYMVHTSWSVFLHVGFALCFLLPLASVMISKLRHDRIAAFWTLGMMLSLLPICATFPMDRLLFFVGIGAMGLLARFLSVLVDQSHLVESSLTLNPLTRKMGILLIVFHLVLAPLLLPVRVLSPMLLSFVTACSDEAPMDPFVAKQSLIIVNSVDACGSYLPLVRAAKKQVIPGRVRILSSGLSQTTYFRPDANTLLVRPEGGYYRMAWERLLRSVRPPVPPGYRVELTDITIEVTQITQDQRPAEATFRFAKPLEDTEYRWIQQQNGHFIPFIPPAIGETITIPAEKFPIF